VGAAHPAHEDDSGGELAPHPYFVTAEDVGGTGSRPL